MLTFQQIDHTKGIVSELESPGFPQVLKYLRDRGIAGQLIDDLGLRIFPAGDLMGRARGVVTRDERLAVVFPHFNVKGDYIDWWSARLVDGGLRPAVVSFANLVPAKRGKMFCPPNEAPRAYLVPTLDWTKLARGDRIYIHESCIKAINGALLDKWSIGLNGVWGWTSRKHGVALVQELKDLPWKALELKPVIVFDSNAEDNWDVQAAISRLAAKILEITGQHASHLLLPRSPDGEHWGFDDFCVRHGAKYASEFLDGDGVPVEISGVEMLKLQLNDEVCVVRGMGRVAEQETGTLMTRAVFTDVNYAHYTAMVERGDTEVLVNVPKLWLADGRRVEVEGLTYMPGEDKIAHGSLNMWHGMGLEPASGDVKPWLELLERNVADAGLRKWMIQWFAYPLQYPGTKLNTYIHLFGPPGSGKQAVIHPLMRIYGKNGVVVGKDQIASTFNSIYANKQFVNLDELHGGGDSMGVAIANRIKMLVTGDKMVVNTKGQPEYEVPNCAQVVSTANYSDAIRLDDDDRRAAVVRFGTRGEGYDKERWEGYFRWVDGDGASAVYAFLLGVDLEGFNPAGWAPMTEDKVEVTRATRRVDEQWVSALWGDPDEVITEGIYQKARALFTTKELAAMCFAEDPTGLTPGKVNSLGIKLHSAGFTKVTIKIGPRPERFWVVRGREQDWDTVAARRHLKVHGFPGVK
jgi:hypothetical protein